MPFTNVDKFNLLMKRWFERGEPKDIPVTEGVFRKTGGLARINAAIKATSSKDFLEAARGLSVWDETTFVKKLGLETPDADVNKSYPSLYAAGKNLKAALSDRAKLISAEDSADNKAEKEKIEKRIEASYEAFARELVKNSELMFLFHILRHVANNSKTTGMDVNNLATMFGPSFAPLLGFGEKVPEFGLQASVQSEVDSPQANAERAAKDADRIQKSKDSEAANYISAQVFNAILGDSKDSLLPINRKLKRAIDRFDFTASKLDEFKIQIIKALTAITSNDRRQDFMARQKASLTTIEVKEAIADCINLVKKAASSAEVLMGLETLKKLNDESLHNDALTTVLNGRNVKAFSATKLMTTGSAFKASHEAGLIEQAKAHLAEWQPWEQKRDERKALERSDSSDSIVSVSSADLRPELSKDRSDSDASAVSVSSADLKSAHDSAVGTTENTPEATVKEDAHHHRFGHHDE